MQHHLIFSVHSTHMSSSTEHEAPAQRRCVGVGNKHGPFRMFVLIYKCHLHTADIYNDTWDVADTPRCLLSLQLQAQSILRNLLVNIHSISFDCNKKGYFDYFLSESEKKKLQKQGVAKLIPPPIFLSLNTNSTLLFVSKLSQKFFS